MSRGCEPRRRCCSVGIVPEELVVNLDVTFVGAEVVVPSPVRRAVIGVGQGDGLYGAQDRAGEHVARQS